MSKPEDTTAQPVDWGLSNLPAPDVHMMCVLSPAEFERLVEAIADRVTKKMAPPDWRGPR